MYFLTIALPQVQSFTYELKHNNSLKLAVQGPALWPTLIHTYE
jgi:hypothetical protein